MAFRLRVGCGSVTSQGGLNAIPPYFLAMLMVKLQGAPGRPAVFKGASNGILGFLNRGL